MRALGRAPQAARDDGGFTLVELLVVTTLLTVVGGMVVTSVVSGLQASRRGQERIYALTELGTATQRATREIRAADPVTIAQADRILVYVERESTLYSYEYTVEAAGSVLAQTRRRYSSPGVVASTDARTLIGELDQGGIETFTYTKADGSGWDASAGDPITQLARVTVTLRRDLPEQNPIEVETSVYVRNSRQ